MEKMYIKDFQNIQRTIDCWCGINISDSKEYLIHTRLKDILFESKCSCYDELIEIAKSGEAIKLRQQIIEKLTTNETYFFRGNKLFDDLREYTIPHMLMSRNKTSYKNMIFRILTIGCATGQESYSIAMMLNELVERKIFTDLTMDNFRIISIDIDSQALKKAKEGIYTQYEMNRGLPDEYKLKYFIQEGRNWRIKDELKKIITFYQSNIIDEYKFEGKFELIFCRNILIYFSQKNKIEILKKLENMFTFFGGYLIIGESENLYDLNPKFKRVRFGSNEMYTI